jgi:hypothetical protein
MPDAGTSDSVFFNRNRHILMAGVYNGVFSVNGDPEIASSGLLSTLNISTKGTYTGKIINQTTKTSLSGSFDAAGTTTLTVPPYTLTGRLAWSDAETANGNKQFIGHVSSTDGWNADVIADLNEKNLTAGTKSTMIIPAVTGGPVGASFATATDSTSTRTFHMSLADGANPVTVAAPASHSGNFPIYAYVKYPTSTEAVGTSLSVIFGTWNSSAGNSLVTLNWIKPAGGRFSPAGFTNAPIATLSPLTTGLTGQHTVVISNSPAFNLNYTMSFVQNGNATLVPDINNSTNKITIHQDATGLLLVTYGTGVKTTTATGSAAVLESAQTGAGFFLPKLGNTNGLIEIH